MDAAKRCDLVILGAIYTGHGFAQGLAAAAGRIEYIGTEEGARDRAAKGARTVHAPLCLPGFHDAHCHPFGAGLRLESKEPQFAGLDEKAIGEKLRRVHEALPPGEPLCGSGINRTMQLSPSPAAFIEHHAPGRRVALQDLGGHVAWASWAAIEQLPMTPGSVVRCPDGACATVSTVADAGGGATVTLEDGTLRVLPVAKLRPRYDELCPLAEDGRPSGYLRNPWASQLMARLRGPLSAEAALKALRRGLRECAARGITAVQDAFVPEGREQTYRELFSQAADGLVLPRCALCLGVRPQAWQASPAAIMERLHRERDAVRGPAFADREGAPLLQARCVKFEVDGSPIDGLSWMLAKYPAAKDGSRGAPVGWTPGTLRDAAGQIAEAGFGVHAHVMGDAAARAMLDALAPWGLEPGQRHTLAHLYQVDRSDLPRFREAGVLALLTPQWLHADWAGVHGNASTLGPERAERFTPIGELLDAGAAVCFGSDWDVIRDPARGLAPLAGLESAVTHRQAGDGPAGLCAGYAGVWQPDGRLTLEEAVRLYTVEAARALSLEKLTGTLEYGKRADLVVLDRNIFDLPPEEIAAAVVTHTFVDGRLAFERTPPSCDGSADVPPPPPPFSSCGEAPTRSPLP